jgi:hypothetical protein
MVLKMGQRRPEKRVGRKVIPPMWITTPEEVKVTLDLVQLSLEAAASQLHRCGYHATSRAVSGIAATIPALKKLARPT